MRLGVEVLGISAPYNPDRLCPKCGNDGVSTAYNAAEDGCGSHCHPPVPEHLARRCERCRYAWWESVR